MMEQIRMDEYCSSVRDGTHDTPKPSENGYYLVTSKAIGKHEIDFSGCYRISKIDYTNINKRSKVDQWDVIMSMIGTVGRLHLVQQEPDYAIKNIALFKIGNESRAKWLYYYLSTPAVQNYFELVASGTSQHFVGLGDLRKFKIENYRRESERITEILSAYDDLIALNNQRIKVLEQMAENLYKEWFVRFRFPGHESTVFENGIPKGWKYGKLFDLAKVTYGYAFSSDEFCEDDRLNAVVRIRDVPNNATKTFTAENCDDKYIIAENAILVGMDGIFHMCLWNGKKAYLNQRVVAIESKREGIDNYYLFLSLTPQVKFWEQTIVGTTVAHLGDKHLKKMTVLIPEEGILRKANDILTNIMKEKNRLFKQNDNLTRQRDLLLPRLMSGKLEVK